MTKRTTERLSVIVGPEELERRNNGPMVLRSAMQPLSTTEPSDEIPQNQLSANGECRTSRGQRRVVGLSNTQKSVATQSSSSPTILPDRPTERTTAAQTSTPSQPSSASSSSSSSELESFGSSIITASDPVEETDHSIAQMTRLALEGKFPKKLVLFGSAKKYYTPVLHLFEFTWKYSTRPKEAIAFKCKVCSL